MKTNRKLFAATGNFAKLMEETPGLTLLGPIYGFLIPRNSAFRVASQRMAWSTIRKRPSLAKAPGIKLLLAA